MTTRRDFLSFVALPAIAALAAGARAQEPGRLYRLALLLPSAPPPLPLDRGTASYLIPSALGALGYVDGRNLVVDRRFADGHLDRLPALARVAIAAQPDAIVAIGSAATRAAMGATADVPIVFYGNFDPIAAGLVTSLAQPGGNLTGVVIAPEGTLAAKKIELLKEAVPAATRIAFLAPSDPGIALQLDEARKAASRIGVELVVVTVKGGDYDRAFAELAAKKPDALFVGAHTLFVRDRRPIIERATRYRLPAVYEWREQVADGGLMSYGSSLQWTTSRVAAAVARIFAGAKPGAIPVEQPTQFSLVINATAANAIGLSLPQQLLLRADEVLR